jgi:RNA polymerase sigma-70 factor, ECF subfamily
MEDALAAELDLQLARLADGDRDAFTPVFKLLQEPILQLCLSMLRNDADARDATQEALEKIFERASDYDRTRPALPWACAIAIWECRTILRRRERRREVSAPQASSEAAYGGEVEIMEREVATAAVKALQVLSERDRETLIATFTGMDIESEISDAGQRKRRQRAIERLRTSFRRLYGLD